MKRVAVSAVSAITSVGDDLGSSFEAMVEGRTGFGPVDRFDVSASPNRYGAFRKDVGNIDAFVQQVVNDLGVEGCIVADRAYFAGEPNGPFPRLPHQIQLPNAVREESGWDRIYTGACVASSAALIDAAAAVCHGLATSVLVVAARLIDDGTFFPFCSASAMTKDMVIRPFSTGRSGLLLGDGAAAFILDSGSSGLPGKPIAELRGWGRSGDGFHVCQPEPEGRGMVSAIMAALKRAKLRPADIDYVSVHGTATQLNDAAEASALKTIFGSELALTRLSSAKSSIGHTLEAAGLIEAAIGIQAITAGIVPPNLGARPQDEPICLGVAGDAVRLDRLEHVLSLNLAFGGSNTALILSRWGAS